MLLMLEWHRFYGYYFILQSLAKNSIFILWFLAKLWTGLLYICYTQMYTGIVTVRGIKLAAYAVCIHFKLKDVSRIC